ncbi:MAG: DUF3262 family protein [Gammaproteobacteria bacterium]|uniref:DUF3262 family protein n=1 Tax=uncultured Pseudacidovorax sp. TaxID=679313 RepID=UPI0025CDEDEE|nr:DUF3262 family protein [uncultured Pseudacidovorax sp.]
MNQMLVDAFKAASGVDPAALQTTVVTLVIAAALLLASWLAGLLIQAYSDDSVSTAEVVRVLILLLIVVLSLITFLLHGR